MGIRKRLFTRRWPGRGRQSPLYVLARHSETTSAEACRAAPAWVEPDHCGFEQVLLAVGRALRFPAQHDAVWATSVLLA